MECTAAWWGRREEGLGCTAAWWGRRGEGVGGRTGGGAGRALQRQRGGGGRLPVLPEKGDGWTWLKDCRSVGRRAASLDRGTGCVTAGMTSERTGPVTRDK